MKSTLTSSVLFLLFSANLTSAQSFNQVISKRPLAGLSASGFSVNIDGIPSGVDWVVALKSDPRDAPHVALLSATLGPALRTNGVRSLTAVKDLPATSYGISQGTVALDLKDFASNGFVVYAVIPPGLPVTCTVDGVPVAKRSSFEGSLMVRSGKIRGQPASITKALQLLSHDNASGQPGSPPEYITNKDGSTLAAQESVKRHVLTRPPAASLNSAGCACVRRTAAVIDIGENGFVSNVVSVSGEGDDVFRSAVAAILGSGRFSLLFEMAKHGQSERSS